VLPALRDELDGAKPDVARVEELLSLLALVPEPAEVDPPSESASVFRATVTRARELMGDKFKRSYTGRRTAADNIRQNPPQHLRKSMFCSAGQLLAVPSEFDE
jgi:hypothetical protein